jgi:uncharacterized membrane protein YhaH (DUF805 family)
MGQFFYIMMILAMLFVLASLVAGIVSMVKGGEFNKKYGNKMMQARVFFQGLALLFFAIAMLNTG